MNDTNESKNSLSSLGILNFLNNSLKEALLLVAAIILMIIFYVKYFLAVWCIPPPKKNIPYDMMERN
jgi:hypothetical protein